MGEGTRECPKCAEVIKAKARVCRFCGHTFAGQPAPPAAAVPAPRTEPELDINEEIRAMKKEGSFGRTFLKALLFLVLFTGTGALGWFLTENGYVDMLYQKITRGKYSAELTFLDSCKPLPVRQGRLNVAISARGERQRINVMRGGSRSGAVRKSTLERLEDSASRKIDRNYVDIGALLNFAEFDPDNPDNNYNLGTGYLWNGGQAKAVDLLVRAVGDLPGDNEAYTNLAIAYYRGGVFDQASKEAHKALDLKGDNVIALNILGLCGLKAKRFTEALKKFQGAVADAPELADSYINLGNTYQAQGNTVLAAEKYRKALELDSGYGAASCNLANIAYAEGKYGEALKLWEQALDNVLLISNEKVAMIERNIKIVKRKLL